MSHYHRATCNNTEDMTRLLCRLVTPRVILPLNVDNSDLSLPHSPTPVLLVYSC